MPFDAWVTLLLNRLLWASLQAAVLAGVIALVIRVGPRIPASARCVLWWLVAAQVVVGFFWPAPVGLPLLAPSAHAISGHIGAQPGVIGAPAIAIARASPAAPSDWIALATWQAGLVLLWVCGLAVQVPSLVRDRLETRRLLRAAEAPTRALRAMCEALSLDVGLQRCPRLLASPGVETPMVTGLVRPVLLWPAAHKLSTSDASLMMAHELAHLRRKDLWWGSVAALAQWMFFFHPLVRRAVREYVIQREAACDAAAVRGCGAEPGDYGELLLRLGVSESLTATLGGASATYRGLKSRLAMLRLASLPAPRIRAWALVAIVASVGIVPYRVVSARAVTHAPPDVATLNGNRGTSNAPAKCSPADPNRLSADGVPFCPATFLTVRGSADPQQSVVAFTHGYVVIEGARADALAAKRFYSPNTNLLWVRQDKKTYLLDDPEIMRRADSLIVPSSQQWSALLNRQGALAEAQGTLTRQQGRLTRLQASLIEASSQPDRSTARDQPTRPSIEARIRAQQAHIAVLQRSLQAQQSLLNKQQEALSAASRAVPERLMRLAIDAIASGEAREIGNQTPSAE